MKIKLHMETTKINPLKTMGEISECLVAIGAKKIVTEYENGEPVGLFFIVPVDDIGNEWPFTLPANVEPVYQILNGRRDSNRWIGDKQRVAQKCRDREQAKRTAWRLILRWVQAQTAMIQIGMVKTQEVFLPYLRREDGRTLFQQIEAKGLKLLSGPSND